MIKIKNRYKLGLLGFAGLVLTVLCHWIFIPALFHWKITTTLNLEEGTVLWNQFTTIDPDFKIYFKLYIFNVTNPQEIVEGGRPKLKEIGPYVFREIPFIHVVKRNVERKTVTIRPEFTYQFVPDLSSGSESDVITMLNTPIGSLGKKVQELSTFSKYGLRFLLKSYEEDAELFVTRTVKAAFFEGTYMELLESISELQGEQILQNNTFGYFYGKNGTIPSYDLELETGATDSSKVGQLVSLNGQKNLKIWYGESCNKLKGSGSAIIPPFLTKESQIHFFETEACLSILLLYQKEEDFQGINAFRFTLSKISFKNDSVENQCYCERDIVTNKLKCPANGAISIASCKFGAPLLISNPYFLYGDPKYNKNVGLSSPNVTLHESFMIAQPETGTLLQGSKRYQISFDLRYSKDIPQLHNIKDVVLPIFWISQELTQPPHVIQQIKQQLIIPLLVVKVIAYISMIVNLSLCIMTLWSLLPCVLKSKSKPLKDDSEVIKIDLLPQISKTSDCKPTESHLVSLVK